MKCWRCREKIPDNARFCPFCQANLSQPDRGQIMKRIKRSIGKKAVPIVLGVVLIGGAAVGGLAIFSGDNDKKPEKNKTEVSDVKENDDTSSETDEKKHDASADSDVVAQAEKALSDYIAETMTYDECADLLRGLKSDDKASADAVTSKLGMADLIKNSRSEFAKAEKAAADGQFSDAILAYQKVISDDPKYYQLAQDKITETAGLYKDSLNSDAEAKIQNKDFRGALDAMSAAQFIFANDNAFVSECEDRKNKIYALWIAYQAQNGNFFDNDGAVFLALEQNVSGIPTDADHMIDMGLAVEKKKYLDAVNAKRGSQMQAVDSIAKLADSKAALLMASDDDGLSFDVSDELEAVFPAWMEWKASKIKGYPNAEQAVASLDASSGEFNPDFGYIGVGLAFDKESKTLTWYVLTVSDKE